MVIPELFFGIELLLPTFISRSNVMLRNLCTGMFVLPCVLAVSYGQSLSLDGVNDWVQLNATAGAFPAGNDPFTIEAWINPDVHGDRVITFWGNSAGNQANGFRLQSTNGLLHFFWSNDLIVTPGDLSPNTGGPNGDGWHHVAITYDGTNRQFYLDGSPFGGSVAAAGGVNVADANHGIGSREGTTEFFDGLIDEVRIWDYARNGGEIGGDFDQILNGTESGLVAYYNFDNGLADLAGNSNPGFQNGALIDTAQNAPVQALAAVPEPQSVTLWTIMAIVGMLAVRRKVRRQH